MRYRQQRRQRQHALRVRAEAVHHVVREIEPCASFVQAAEAGLSHRL